MKEITVPAQIDQLMEVTAFVDQELEAHDCSMKAQMQIELALDEILTNIASYAYKPGTGDATIRVDIDSDTRMATIVFLDSGVPYDPLQKADPDTTLSADERQIGGLGIFLVKKTMDDMFYAYEDGKNVLTLKKKI